MDDRDAIRRVAPERLGAVRDLAHAAVQLATRAALANLPAVPDDSHSNLGWEARHGALVSQPIAGKDGTYMVGVTVADLELLVLCDGQVIEAFALGGETRAGATSWLDARLEDAGLAPTGLVVLPYELPASVAGIDAFGIDGVAEDLSVLAHWYGLAHHVLSEFAHAHSDLDPGPSPVRCWPHHFDIATYVSLERGDFETARGIGVGMSPGDDAYPQPYFYVNPWPSPVRDGLSILPAPGRWHTEGYVGAIATANDVLSLTDISADLGAYIDRAFGIERGMLNA